MRTDFHEFLIRVAPTEIVRKQKYTSIKPTGMVVQQFNVPRKRRKWIEICADLCDPTSRPTRRGPALPSKREENFTGMVREYGQRFWDAVCERWTPALKERWIHVDRLPEGAEKEFAIGTFWNEEIEAVSGFRDALGRDPTGTADLLDTWLFTNLDRRTFLILPNSDMTAHEAAAQAGQQTVTRKGITVLCPVAQVDWEADLGFTEEARGNLKNPLLRHDPRFDLQAPKTLFRAGDAHPDLGKI